MASRRTETGTRFIRRVVPHFIEPYAAGPDVWSRASPVLLVAYVAGGLNGLDLAHWSWQRNLAAGGVVLVLLLATWALTNLLRHRSVLSQPAHLGAPELAAFLLGPAVPSLVFSQWGDAVQAVAEGAAVLTVIYMVTSYGVIPLVGWVAAQVFSQIAAVGRMVTRALPLLLLFTTFLFINAEVWQVAGTLQGPVFLAVLALFLVLGSDFVLSRVPEAIRSVHDFDDWAEVAALVRGTPAESLPLPQFGDPMVIPEATTAAWTALDDLHLLARLHVSGRTLVLTEPLLRVAGFLGAFSGMYFTVVLGTDATYRDEFAKDAGPEIRQALAVRLAYRHAAKAD